MIGRLDGYPFPIFAQNPVTKKESWNLNQTESESDKGYKGLSVIFRRSGVLEHINLYLRHSVVELLLVICMESHSASI